MIWRCLAFMALFGICAMLSIALQTFIALGFLFNWW